MAQSGNVVLDFEQGLALLAMINDGIKRIGLPAIRVDALEPGSI